MIQIMPIRLTPTPTCASMASISDGSEGEMRAAFVAIWYDPKKMEANAIRAGWDPASGVGFLDVYHPEEDPNGHEELECNDLDSAVVHLRNIVADGMDFWGQGRIREFVVDGRRCAYCTCRGWRCVKEYDVDDTGIVRSEAVNDCAEDD